MRVCQPGPVARQRSMTSGVRREEIDLRGLADKGRPPFIRGEPCDERLFAPR